MITVAIAEDHVLVRQGIEALLARTDDIQVVGEAEDGDQALDILSESTPDVLIMDISMPGKSGLETLRELQARDVKTAVVMLTMHADRAVMLRAMNGGAKGYVLKGSIADDLIRAIRIASRGGTFIAPGLTESLQPSEVDDAVQPLTPREVEVLELIAEGITNRAIGDKLSISVKTVERHRTRIMRKLNSRNVVELIRNGLRFGYIEFGD